MTMTFPPQTENETFSGFVAHRLHISSVWDRGRAAFCQAQLKLIHVEERQVTLWKMDFLSRRPTPLPDM